MKIQIDTNRKEIKLEGSVNLRELFAFLNNFFPDFSWGEYSLAIDPVYMTTHRSTAGWPVIGLGTLGTGTAITTPGNPTWLQPSTTVMGVANGTSTNSLQNQLKEVGAYTDDDVVYSFSIK